MTGAANGKERPSPLDLWRRIRAILAEQDGPGVSDTSDIPAVVGMFDNLSAIERAFIAAQMCAELRDVLAAGKPFEPLHYAILALAEPYLKRSDLQLEARMLIGAAFRAFAEGKRDFDELQALGLALADLEYKVPGAAADWEQFYQFFSDLETREDALDVALAGTAASSIATFSRLIRSVPLDGWAIERLNAYAPTLVKNHAPREVELLLTELDGARSDQAIKQQLRRIADLYELKIRDDEKDESPVRLIAEQLPVPPELRFAWKLIENEEARGVQRDQLIAALDRRLISVVRSDYSGAAALRNFQNELIDLIEKLNGRDDVRSIESPEFTQLPAEISGRRKVVFAFPTYLTAAKQDAGYSVCAFGYQRRVGVLYPSTSRFATTTDRPATLEDLLHEVQRRTGDVWCLKNYAISEIVMQAAAIDPVTEAYFADRLIPCEPARSGGFTPLPKAPAKGQRNFVFIYDLAGHDAISAQVTAQARARGARRGKAAASQNWLDDARVDIIGHNVDVPVGIGFTKYLVRWLLEDGAWDKISDLVAKWQTRPDFRRALSALGVEQDPPRPVEPDKVLPRPNLKSVKSV